MKKEQEERIFLAKAEEKTRKPRISWRDWEKKEGRYLLLAVFTPSKFPSSAVIFETEDAQVQKTIENEIARTIVKEFKNYEGDLYVSITRKDKIWEFHLEKEKGDGTFFYSYDGKNLIRKRQIPF